MGSGVLKKVGGFTGTGAEKTVSLDFTPRYVKVTNITDKESVEAWEGAALNLKEVIAGTKSTIAKTAGITLGEMGFTVFTDNACNGAADSLVFIAHE